MQQCSQWSRAKTRRHLRTSTSLSIYLSYRPQVLNVSLSKQIDRQILETVNTDHDIGSVSPIDARISSGLHQCRPGPPRRQVESRTSPSSSSLPPTISVDLGAQMARHGKAKARTKQATARATTSTCSYTVRHLHARTVPGLTISRTIATSVLHATRGTQH